MQTPVASVIFTTYNQPAWLEKVLVGFGHQDRRDFEVLVYTWTARLKSFDHQLDEIEVQYS